MGDWSSTVPSHTAGATSDASKLQTLDDIATALTGAWTSWSPTLTNLTVGAGTLSSTYRRLGKTLDYDFFFTYGASGSAVGTVPKFTLPYTLASRYTATNYTAELGRGLILDSSGGVSRPILGFWATSGVEIYYWNGTPSHTNITSTAPWTWAVGDTIHMFATLELA